MNGPTITLGGTSKTLLFDAHLEARGKLIEARKALGEIEPNGRDYLTPAVFALAQTAHAQRISALDAMIDDVYDITIHIDEQE